MASAIRCDGLRNGVSSSPTSTSVGTRDARQVGKAVDARRRAVIVWSMAAYMAGDEASILRAPNSL